MANPSASAFATASPASVGPAAFSRRWPASPLPIRLSAPQPSTCGSATKEPGSSSDSALCAGQRYSTPKRVANNRLRVSPWVPSPTQAFRHLETRSMTAADILGCSYRQGQGRMTRTPSNSAYGPEADRFKSTACQSAVVALAQPYRRFVVKLGLCANNACLCGKIHQH